MFSFRAEITVIAMLCCSAAFAQDAPQVSVQILSNGESSMTVQAGAVDLQLDLRLSTNIGLAGMQFSLDCSAPNLFVYATPAVTLGTPFTSEDMAFVPINPPARDGVSLADHPLVTFFRMESGNYAPEGFPSVIFSYHVRSVESLPGNSSYVFTLTENDFLPFWMNDKGGGQSVSGKVAVGSSGTFTLQVSGEGGGGTTPGGDGGTTPGDGGAPPDDGGTLPSDGGTTPADGGSTEPEGGSTPGDGGMTPGDGGAGSGDEAVTPGDGGSTPSDDAEQNSGPTPTTTPTGAMTFCGSGTGPAIVLATMVGLWLIAPQARRMRRERAKSTFTG